MALTKLREGALLADGGSKVPAASLAALGSIILTRDTEWWKLRQANGILGDPWQRGNVWRHSHKAHIRPWEQLLNQVLGDDWKAKALDPADRITFSTFIGRVMEYWEVEAPEVKYKTVREQQQGQEPPTKKRCIRFPLLCQWQLSGSKPGLMLISDNQLVVGWVNGIDRPKAPHAKWYVEQLHDATNDVVCLYQAARPSADLWSHVNREFNCEADELASLRSDGINLSEAFGDRVPRAFAAWCDGGWDEKGSGCGWIVRIALDADDLVFPPHEWPLLASASFELAASSSMEAELQGAQSLLRFIVAYGMGFEFSIDRNDDRSLQRLMVTVAPKQFSPPLAWRHVGGGKRRRVTTGDGYPACDN